MKRSLPLIFDTLHALAIALWIGSEVSTLIFAGIGTIPRAFQMRSDGLTELAGIAIVCIQFLTRRRFQNNKTLFVGDGIRHLLTFAGLMMMEYVKLNIHQKAMAGLGPGQLENALAALQLVILASVSTMTIWLQSPHALAFAATLNAARAQAPVQAPIKPAPAPAKTSKKR